MTRHGEGNTVPVEVICCEGPPLCMFEGDAAVTNALQGCPLCRHIVIHPDGTETEYRRKSN